MSTLSAMLTPGEVKRLRQPQKQVQKNNQIWKLPFKNNVKISIFTELERICYLSFDEKSKKKKCVLDDNVPHLIRNNVIDYGFLFNGN